MKKQYINPQITATAAQFKFDLAVNKVSSNSDIGGGSEGGDPHGGRGKNRYDDYDEEEDFFINVVLADEKQNSLW